MIVTVLSSSKFGSKLNGVVVFTAESLAREELCEVDGGDVSFLAFVLREMSECAHNLTFLGFFWPLVHLEDSNSFACSLTEVGESGGEADKDGSELFDGS
jgi:hypothetical protein